MRTIRSLFLGLVLAFIFLIAIIVIISYFNKDGVTNYIIKEVNKQIIVKVDADEVNLRLFKKFPYASIELNNVVALSDDYFTSKILGYNTDTLFRAKKVFLEFHLIDILTKKYKIKNIHFDNAKINLFVNNKSEVNYNLIQKSDNQTSDSIGYVLNINELRLTNSQILYCNASKNIIFDTRINKSILKGNFYKDKFDLKVTISNYVNKLKIQSKTYLKDVSTAIVCDVDVDDNTYYVKTANLLINDCLFNISGWIVKNKQAELDLSLITSNTNVKKIFQLIPDTKISKYNNNIANGKISFSTTIKGSFTRTSVPLIIADLTLKDGEYCFNKARIRNIKFNGAYSNGNQNNERTSSLILNDIYAEIKKSNFIGELEIKNFESPTLKFNSKAKVQLNEMSDLFSTDTIEKIEGTAEIKFGYAGDIDEFNVYNIFSSNFYCDFRINDGLLKLKKSKYEIENISGFANINEDVYINDLYFEINENDFLVNGLASNFYNFFKNKDKLYLNADVKSNKIDIDKFLSKDETKSETKDVYINFPENIQMRLNIDINKFSFNKFYASDIKGKINYKPRMFSLREISFNSMKGSARLGCVVIQKYNKDFVLQSQSNLENIDIENLFHAFNNFGQNFLVEKNLSGNITGNIFLSSQWKNNFDIYEDKINCESNFVITNGALINFEPMQGLSRFIDVDELKNINFSTLKNNITIKDKKIIIPQMNINSNAFNITASGTHYFDNNYSYNIKLSLKEFLVRKLKKNNSFGVIEEDDVGNTYLYLNIKGDAEDFKVKYDKKTARNVRKQNFIKEKQRLKTILNQEFGFFKKDSNIVNNTKEKNSKFQINWNKKDTIKKEQNKFDSQKFNIVWDEDSVSK